MSPKTNQSSSNSSKHQGGGASSSSSSSLDLYNKTHDFVLSRTPDQSRTAQYLHQVMRIVVAQISMEIGWNSAQLSALDVLSDLCIRYLLQAAKQSKKYTEHYGRTLVNENDIALGFKDMNISISELEEYIQNFEPVSIPKDVPYFPVPRKTDLNFLRPGSSEVLTRPVHVHEYMPPMIFEESDGSDSEKEKENDKDITTLSEGVSQVKVEGSEEATPTTEEQPNGIMMPLILEEPSQVPEVASELVVSENQPVVTEEVEIKTENAENGDSLTAGPIGSLEETQIQQGTLNDLKNDLEDSSDDDIEPAASKAASIFATFKSTKKLESASENAAIKRIRKMLEDQGHPLREVSSVIMTSSGYLSESREGRVAESRPPVIRDIIEESPPPEQRKKIPTMKKILEGVKKVDKGRSDSEDEMEEGPGLFGVMDKIIASTTEGQIENAADVISAENGDLPDRPKKEILKKKLSKQEKKLQKHKKALKDKKLKLKSKDKLVKHAKSNLQAAAAKESLDASSSMNKSKLLIFKKPKSSKLDGSSSSSSKKKKKDKKNKLKIKNFKMSMAPPLAPPLEEESNLLAEPPLKEISVPSTGTELIESDEDFSTGTTTTTTTSGEQRVVPPMHIVKPSQFSGEQIPIIRKKKIKKDLSDTMDPVIFDFQPLPQQPSKKLLKAAKTGFGLATVGHPPIPKAKLPKLQKRPLLSQGGLEGDDGLPIKKKRGRPKKVWGDGSGLSATATPPGIPPSVGPGALHPAQLASIGKSLMIKEPALKIMKIRKEHMEVQDLAPGPPPSFTTKTVTATISPSKSSPGGGSSIVSADLLKRLPAQPGLIPDKIAPVPPVRLPKELPASISITPAALPSPQKEMGPSGSRNFPGANLPPNVCSSVTITRIDMSQQQKLPSPYDDSVTPGIGPPPGLEGPHKRNKLVKGVPRPPPLQPQILGETESGITITPIMMGGGHKEHRYDEPLPPPPPLQARPQPKHSMLAKLDEELSSGSSSVSTTPSSKEQRKKDKEKRKELKKEKKKKAKDKSKDKSEKKKKKKDKSGGESSSVPTGGDSMDLPAQATVPKLTLKLSGHSNTPTPTPVDSPNPPQVFHDPVVPLPPKKLTFKGLIEESTPPKPPKQRVSVPPPAPPPPAPSQEEEDLEVARFAPLVTRPQKPSRAAKTHAVAGIAAVSIGATYSQQEIVQFPPTREARDSIERGGGSRRGRGRPPKGGPMPMPEVVKGINPLSTPKQPKSSVTVLETETVGCMIDEEGNKIWICPACGRQDDGSPMIGCDQCDDWYHFPCVGITEPPSEEDQWYCERCVRKRQKTDSGKQKKKK